jgi:hypothetical protein
MPVVTGINPNLTPSVKAKLAKTQEKKDAMIAARAVRRAELAIRREEILSRARSTE